MERSDSAHPPAFSEHPVLSPHPLRQFQGRPAARELRLLRLVLQRLRRRACRRLSQDRPHHRSAAQSICHSISYYFSKPIFSSSYVCLSFQKKNVYEFKAHFSSNSKHCRDSCPVLRPDPRHPRCGVHERGGDDGAGVGLAQPLRLLPLPHARLQGRLPRLPTSALSPHPAPAI